MIEHNRQLVLLVIEGTKDALAAAELLHRCDYLHKAGILCALGSGYRPIANEIEQLRGRQLRVIADNDAASRETASTLCAALAQAQVAVALWQWDQHDPKDLFDFLAGLEPSTRDQLRELLQKRFCKVPNPNSNGSNESCVVEGLLPLNSKSEVFPFPPSYRSTVQLFNYTRRRTERS